MSNPNTTNVFDLILGRNVSIHLYSDITLRIFQCKEKHLSIGFINVIFSDYKKKSCHYYACIYISDLKTDPFK